MLTFYAKFLPSMSTLLAPLYRLLEKNSRWQWKQPQEIAFNRAKQRLKEAKVLVHFDPAKELKLESDASPYGLGAVLFHTSGNVHKPIGFRSRTLTQAERNYSQLEREALALVFGVTKFRDYLLGREFTLVTDHQPLLGLLRADRLTPAMPAARIQRWALYLGGYRYKLHYVPGKQLLNSDALSRLPMLSTEPEDDGEPPEYVLSLQTLDDGVVTSRELKDFTAADSTLARVKHYILRGWPKSTKGLEPSLLPFYDRKLELSVAHELLYWGNRAIIPVKAQSRMLQLLHETHQGSSAMKSVARSLFWWPGLDRDIERLSANCDNCIMNLPMPTAAPPVPWPKTLEKWSRLHIDSAGPLAGKMILVVVDSHSKWIEAVPTKHATTASTISCLRNIFSHFGVPRTIVSENGTQFTSQEFATFVKKNHITHLRTAPFHPQSNGAAERAVRTVKDGLRKMKEGILEDKLSRLLFNYRRTPQRTGKSPSEMLLRYRIRSRLDACFPQTVAEPPQGRNDWAVQPDSTVYVRNYGVGEKWTPGRVKTTTRMATVETPTAVIRRHTDQVRPRHDASPQSLPDSRASNATEASGRASPSQAVEAAVGPSAQLSPDREQQLHYPTTPPSSTTKTDAGGAQPAIPRRSTRLRKPIDRFHY
ncbi:uncharacterized protein ISCGN_031970 [Ixodes scapularis]